MSTLLLLALAACQPAVQSPDQAPPVEPAAPEASVRTPEAAEQAPTVDAPLVDGAAYGGLYLVVLSSSRVPGERPVSLELLSQREELELARLASSHFKGLMPCFEIVVAGGWRQRSEALAVSASLKEQGVDNYVKNAGAYVGEDARVSAYCEGSGEASSCASPARFVSSLEGVAVVHLGLDPVASERALEGAPEVQARDEAGTQWSASLGLDAVEGWRKGDALALLLSDRAQERSCTVTGFAALVEGQPHFGWTEGERTQPGCGEVEVVATLDCALSGEEARAALVLPPDADYELARPGPGEASGAVLSALRRVEGWSELEAAAEGGAEERGQPLLTETEAVTWRSTGGQVLSLVTTTWSTGEGYDACGGEDLRLVASAALDPRGAAPLPLGRAVDASFGRTVGMLRLDGAWLRVEAEDFGGAQLLGTDGEPVCEQDYAYCDCPC